MRRHKIRKVVIATGFEVAIIVKKTYQLNIRNNYEIPSPARGNPQVIQIQYKTFPDKSQQGVWSNFVLIERSTVALKNANPAIQIIQNWGSCGSF